MFTSDWLVSPPSIVFEVQMSKFYHEQMPKAAKMKTIYPHENFIKVIKTPE